MNEPKDKRTKAYKVWKEQQGLGDTIEAVLQSKPLKKITKVIKKAIWKDNEDCGCNERKEKLNKLLSYRRKQVRCFTEQQHSQYKLYRERRTLNVWKEVDIHLLIKLYAHAFAIQYKANNLCRNCSGSGKILLNISKELDKVYESYE